MKVESKYKNPDRYIAKLKMETDEAWRSSRRWKSLFENRIGEIAVRWAANVVCDQSCSDKALTKLNPGDTIYHEAVVTMVKSTPNGGSAFTADLKHTHVVKAR